MDLNGDGNNDILSGSYSRRAEPMAGLFQVLWGNPDGTFKTAAVLKGTDDKPLIISSSLMQNVDETICTRPTAVDWDADGDLDLVVGNKAGTFYLFTGEGSGKFKPKSQLINAGKELLLLDNDDYACHSDPFFVDWDKDGDLDLLSGSARGGVYWAENTAGPKKPIVLKPLAGMISAPAEVKQESWPKDVNGPNGDTRVWAADLNADGKLDLLVGDWVNLISIASGVSEAEFATRDAEWKAAQAAVQLELNKVKSPDPAVYQPIFDKLNQPRERRKKCLSEDQTGFVWVYLRK